MPVGSTLKIQGLTIVEADGPLHVEYALFDPEERELGRGPSGACELGFRTSVNAARVRLAQLGVTEALAQSFARIMSPALSEAFARGPAVRRVTGLVDARVLFESCRYDPVAGVYEGLFLDLVALEAELGRKSVTVAFQALFLGALLAATDERAPIELHTQEHAATLKPGAHTYVRVTLPRMPELPSALAELARRGGGRGARGAALGPARLLELLRLRLVGGAKLAACVRALEATREMPRTGVLAQPALWEVELLLESGNHAAAAQKLLALERKGGRTPVTAYLRARLELLSRAEPAEVVARRVSALAQGPAAFPEIVTLAAEASLAAGDEGRAVELARQALAGGGLSESLRDRAATVLQSAGAAPARDGGQPSPASGRAATVASAAGPDSRRSAFPDPRSEPEPGEAPSQRPPSAPKNPVSLRKAPPPIPTSSPPPAALAGVGAAREVSSLPPTAASLRPEVRSEGSAPPAPGEPAGAWESDAVTARPFSYPPPQAIAAVHEVPGRALERPGSAPVAANVGPSARPGDGGARTPPGGNLASVRVHVPAFPGDRGAPAAESWRPPESRPPESRPPESRPPESRSRPPESRSRPPESRSNPPVIEHAGRALEDTTGASRPPSVQGVAPPWFGCAPSLPRVDPAAVELAEELALPLPPGLSATPFGLERRAASVLEARLQSTFLARELGARYRSTRGVGLRADLSGIELMQSYLVERFASGQVDGPDGAREVLLHGAFLSEILARRLGAEWIDLRAERPGHWEMLVAPGTHVWPFARVARFVARGHRERDLVAYFLELQTHALLAATKR